MLTRFMPDFFFDSFEGVTPDFLAAHGIRFLLTDIDNTLAPYEEAEPNERVKAWAASMKTCGVTVILVSNNREERVTQFNRALGFAAFADCHKPSVRSLRGILAQTGAVLSETAALGDQIFTDVWGAKKLGIRAILVPPIRDKRSLFFRFKRFLEKPILKKFHRMRGENA